MIKSKKNVNHYKRSFLTKKNRYKKGGGRNIDITFTTIPDIVVDDEFVEFDISGIPDLPPVVPPVDYETFEFTDEDPSSGPSNKLIVNIKNSNSLLSKTIDYFFPENNELEKFEELLKIYGYFKEQKKKNRRYKFFEDKDISKYKDNELKTENTVSVRGYKPPVNRDNFTFYHPRLHGCHDKNCAIRTLPKNVYLCFFTKFNNLNIITNNNRDKSYFQTTEFFENLDRDTFELIKSKLALYGIDESLEVQTHSHKNYNIFECFKSATWYYPSQFYLDLYMENRYFDDRQSYLKINQKVTKKLKKKNYDMNQDIYLSEYIEFINGKDPTTTKIIFLDVGRTVKVTDSNNHIDMYFKYEYLIRNLNRYLEKNNSSGETQKPPKLKSYCAKVSLTQQYIIDGSGISYLYNTNAYKYNLNYHVETEILVEIDKYITDNGNTLLPEHIKYISSLSPKKIILFLHKHNEELMGILFDDMIKNINFYLSNIFNLNKDERLFTNTFLFKISLLEKLYLNFKPGNYNYLFRYLKSPSNISIKLSDLVEIFLGGGKKKFILKDMTISEVTTTPIDKEVKTIFLKNVNSGGKPINFLNTSELEEIIVTGSSRIISVSQVINRSSKLKTLILEDYGYLIERPEQFDYIKFTNLEILKISNVQISGSIVLINTGALGKLHTLYLENTDLSDFVIIGQNLKRCELINNRKLFKIRCVKSHIEVFNIKTNGQVGTITIFSEKLSVDKLYIDTINLVLDYSDISVKKELGLKNIINYTDLKKKFKSQNVTYFILNNCQIKKLTDILNHSKFKKIQKLELENCPNLEIEKNNFNIKGLFHLKYSGLNSKSTEVLDNIKRILNF